MPFQEVLHDRPCSHNILQYRNDWSLKNNFRFRLGMNSPLLDSFMVTNHPLHSVALDSIQISSQKNIFNDASFFLRKAKRFENVSAEMVQCVITPFYISHDRKSFLLIFPAGYCHNTKLFWYYQYSPYYSTRSYQNQ